MHPVSLALDLALIPFHVKTLQQSFPNRRAAPSAVPSLSVHCRLWWNPLFALLGGPKVFLHTVFQLEDTAQVLVLCAFCSHPWIGAPHPCIMMKIRTLI